MEILSSKAPLTAIRRCTPLFLARLFFVEFVLVLIFLLWSWHIDMLGWYSDDARIALHDASNVIYLILTLIQGIVFIVMSISWYMEYFTITSSEIVHRKGWIVRREQSYPLATIHSMGMFRSFRGRIFNYGTVTLIMPMMGKEVRLYEISRPEQFIEMVKSAVQAMPLQAVPVPLPPHQTNGDVDTSQGWTSSPTT